MPKEIHEIKNFQAGIISSPSTTDIPEEAATFSKNIDCASEAGVLKGIPVDSNIVTGINATSGDILNDALIYFDPDKKKLFRIDDFNNVGSETSDFIYISDWNSSTDLSLEAIDGITTSGSGVISMIDKIQGRNNVLKWTNTAAATHNRVILFDTTERWGPGDKIRIKFDYLIPAGSDVDWIVPYNGNGNIHGAPVNNTEIFGQNGNVWTTYEVTAIVHSASNDSNDYHLKIYFQAGDGSVADSVPSGNVVYLDAIEILNVSDIEESSEYAEAIIDPVLNHSHEFLYAGMGKDSPPLHISQYVWM